MMFTDAVFVPFFLVVLFFANFVFKNKNMHRIFFLTIASYVFYASWNWKFSFLIFISTVIDYFLGFRIHNAKKGRLGEDILF